MLLKIHFVFPRGGPTEHARRPPPTFGSDAIVEDHHVGHANPEGTSLIGLSGFSEYIYSILLLVQV